MFFEKGFIGTIGDDLPSLIPIIVALLLFFTIFSITLNTYTQKNFFLRQNITLMNVSRELKGDSLILNVDNFLNNCSKMQVNNYKQNFMAAIYSNEKIAEMFTVGESFLDDFKNVNPGFPSDTENFLQGLDKDGYSESYFCFYKKLGGRQITSARANYSTRFYPVAFQERVEIGGIEYIIISPGMMVMVIW
jgi:hypothetical protein